MTTMTIDTAVSSVQLLDQIATSIPARVAAGADWLDRTLPGWLGDIDLDTLDLSDGCYCVLGQVLGSYDESPLSVQEASAFGFHCTGVTPSGPGGYYSNADMVILGAEYAALTDAWRHLVEQRRAAQNSAVA